MKTTRPSVVGLGDWPRLTRFYGIGPNELARMPAWLTRLYAEKLPEIEAQEVMRDATVSVIPHVTDSDRNRILRDIGRRARSSEETAAPIDPTTDTGRAALAGMGIGVTVDSPGIDNG